MSKVDSGIIDDILKTILETFAVQERNILADPYFEVGEDDMGNAILSRAILELSMANQSDYVIKDWPEEFPIVWWTQYQGHNKRVDVVFKGECYIWTNNPWWDRENRTSSEFRWYMRKRMPLTKFRLVKLMVPLWVQVAAMFALNGMPWVKVSFGEQNEIPSWHEHPNYYSSSTRNSWYRRRRFR